MPSGSNASILLAKAVALSTQARTLGKQVSAAAQPEITAIELEASNIRVLLTDTLRGAYLGQPTLEQFERRLRLCAERLDELERQAAQGH